jgi:hypothetical protein
MGNCCSGTNPQPEVTTKPGKLEEVIAFVNYSDTFRDRLEPDARVRKECSEDPVAI